MKSNLGRLRTAIAMSIETVLPTIEQQQIPVKQIVKMIGKNKMNKHADANVNSAWAWNDFSDRALAHIKGAAKFSNMFEVTQPGGKYTPWMLNKKINQ